MPKTSDKTAGLGSANRSMRSTPAPTNPDYPNLEVFLKGEGAKAYAEPLPQLYPNLWKHDAIF
ncbi:uncharacterized protein PG998_012451 [Apiospora kogelbergensis]|uniref:Uncharacterized protein n=1 Tax=Apiospora kogelbergensis TaxID=1337665 RepID=A0AAW0QTB1_9PEZI